MKLPASFLFSILLFAGHLCKAQPNQSGSDVIRMIHKRFYNKPCRTYTFSQKNTHYRNDSVTGHSEWHEAVQFPDKFRINFGEAKDGNYVIYRNDSAFRYKDHVLERAKSDSSTVLLLIGGMYYRSIDDVMRRLERKGYRLIVLSEQKWEGRDALVVGANPGDMVANQIWIDKKTLRVLRIVEKMNAKDMMDMRFEAHQPWCNGYMETKVSFRRNGKLEQVEEYYNIRTADRFPDR